MNVHRSDRHAARLRRMLRRKIARLGPDAPLAGTLWRARLRALDAGEPWWSVQLGDGTYAGGSTR